MEYDEGDGEEDEEGIDGHQLCQVEGECGLRVFLPIGGLEMAVGEPHRFLISSTG